MLEDKALKDALVDNKWKGFLAGILQSKIDGYIGTTLIKQDLL